MKQGRYRLIFVYLLVFLICLGGVFGVKPAAQYSIGGLSIIEPKFEYYPNNALKLHFHVFNSSGGLINASCNVHVYNNTGHHIIETNMTHDTNEQEEYYSFNPLSIGSYSYIVWCVQKTNLQMGFLSDGFYINTYGDNQNPVDATPLAIIILLPFLIAILLIFIAHSLGEVHNILKIFIMLLSMVFTFVAYNFGTLVLIRYFNISELQDAIGTNMYWFVICFGVIIFYFFIYLIIAAFKTMQQKKAEKLEY